MSYDRRSAHQRMVTECDLHARVAALLTVWIEEDEADDRGGAAASAHEAASAEHRHVADVLAGVDRRRRAVGLDESAQHAYASLIADTMRVPHHEVVALVVDDIGSWLDDRCRIDPDDHLPLIERIADQIVCDYWHAIA